MCLLLILKCTPAEVLPHQSEKNSCCFSCLRFRGIKHCRTLHLSTTSKSTSNTNHSLLYVSNLACFWVKRIVVNTNGLAEWVWILSIWNSDLDNYALCFSINGNSKIAVYYDWKNYHILLQMKQRLYIFIKYIINWRKKIHSYIILHYITKTK